MRVRPTKPNERIASAMISGIGYAYANLRLSSDQAHAEIHETLAGRKVAPDRVRDVLSDAASMFIDEGPYGAHALALLVEAGADAALARIMRDEVRRESGEAGREPAGGDPS